MVNRRAASGASDSDLDPMVLHSANPMQALMEGLASQVGGLKGNDKAAYDNLAFFSRHVMADEGMPANSRFLESIYEKLQYSENRDWLILGPRQSAKSTAVTVTYSLWKIGRNPLLRFMMAFASMEMQGQAFARQIDQVVTRNNRYMKIFGQLKPDNPDKWTEREKIFVRKEPPGGMKDPTISIVGLGSNVPSRRADELIGDDLVTGDNAYSQKERATTKAFLLQSLFPILVPGGRRIILGSMWDPRDLYNELAAMWGLEIPPQGDIDLAELREIAMNARGFVENAEEISF